MFVCVSLCQYVSVCVVFVVLLVASVLASMRWLLCRGDGSKEKSVVTEKYPANDFSITVLLKSKNKSALNYNHFSFFYSKTIKSAPRISAIIFGGMVTVVDCAESNDETWCMREPVGEAPLPWAIMTACCRN